MTVYAHFDRNMNGSHGPPRYIGTRVVTESAIMDLQCSTVHQCKALVLKGIRLICLYKKEIYLNKLLLFKVKWS